MIRAHVLYKAAVVGGLWSVVFTQLMIGAPARANFPEIMTLLALVQQQCSVYGDVNIRSNRGEIDGGYLDCPAPSGRLMATYKTLQLEDRNIREAILNFIEKANEKGISDELNPVYDKLISGEYILEINPP